MEFTSTKTNNNFVMFHEITFGKLINLIIFTKQIFVNLLHILNKHDNHDNLSLKDKIQHHIKLIYNHKTLQKHDFINLSKSKTEFLWHIIYNNMKLQRLILQNFYKKQTQQNHFKWLWNRTLWADHLHLLTNHSWYSQEQTLNTQ